jgi:WD40 repeat protein
MLDGMSNELRPLLAATAIVTVSIAYACTPYSEPLDPVVPEARPEAPPSTPVVPIGDRDDDPRPSTEPPPPEHTRTTLPPGAPKVASSIAFDILASDASKPVADDNNEISWFLGSSSPNPSWSPDGHRIAHYDGRCVSIHGDDGALVGKLRTRVKDSECRGPRWAPDGHAIVTSHTFHGPGVIFDLGAKGSRVTGGPGSGLMGNDSDGLWSLSWLSDNKHLVGRIHQSGAVLVDAAKRGQTVPLVSDEVPTMQGYFPTFSPSGRHFARVLGEWTGPGELEVVALNLATARTTKVKDPWETTQHEGRIGARAFAVRGPILEHEWSRDGAHIVAIRAKNWYAGYGNFDYGFGELLWIDVPSGEVRVLATGAKNPSVAPDGKFVAFESSQGDLRLVEVAAPELGAWPLQRGGVEPQWSPAGQAILTLDPGKEQGVVLLLERP